MPNSHLNIRFSEPNTNTNTNMTIDRLPLSLNEAITLADADYASWDLELFPKEPIRRTRLSDLLAGMDS